MKAITLFPQLWMLHLTDLTILQKGTSFPGVPGSPGFSAILRNVSFKRPYSLNDPGVEQGCGIFEIYSSRAFK